GPVCGFGFWGSAPRWESTYRSGRNGGLLRDLAAVLLPPVTALRPAPDTSPLGAPEVPPNGPSTLPSWPQHSSKTRGQLTPWRLPRVVTLAPAPSMSEGSPMAHYPAIAHAGGAQRPDVSRSVRLGGSQNAKSGALCPAFSAVSWEPLSGLEPETYGLRNRRSTD